MRLKNQAIFALFQRSHSSRIHIMPFFRMRQDIVEDFLEPVHKKSPFCVPGGWIEVNKTGRFYAPNWMKRACFDATC